MKLLQCLTGGYAMVDDDDHRAWRGYRWGQSQGYVCADFKMVGMRKPRRFYLHRLLAKPTAGQQVHHRNKCRWDDRRENLECLSIEEHARRHPESRALASLVQERKRLQALWLDEQRILSLLREGH